MLDLPRHIKPKSRTQVWKENNRSRYNAYQKNYMKAYRARKKLREQAQHGED